MVTAAIRVVREQVVTFFGTIGCVLILWWLATTTGLANPSIFPKLNAIFSASTELRDSTDATFWHHVIVTSWRVLIALMIGLALGYVTGVLFWRFPLFGKAVEPYLVAFYAVPLVVFYPLLLVLLGINSKPVILLSAIMCAIPIALNTWIGFRDQPAILQRLASALRMTTLLRFIRVEAPAAMPQFLVGAKIGVVYCLVGTIGMEFMVSSQGLGYAVRFQYETFNVPSMYFYLGTTLLLSFMIVTGLLAGSAVILRHHMSVDS